MQNIVIIQIARSADEPFVFHNACTNMELAEKIVYLHYEKNYACKKSRIAKKLVRISPDSESAVIRKYSDGDGIEYFLETVNVIKE